MPEKKVIYNGVSMHPSWPAQIELAQTVTKYIINGKEFKRIKHGNEADIPDDFVGTCHDCRVQIGQYHVGPVCDMEECPRCNGQVFSCDCEYEGDED